MTESLHFAQPFVFLGKVGADRKVSPISTATIKLKLGADVQTLSKLADFDLDYKMPSELGGGLTEASDPTRILYYGYSYPKAWCRYLIDHAEGLASGAEKTVELPGCLVNGGLIAVPVSKERTELPLAEFHLNADDIMQVARKSGSYTALTGFYQGSIDASGALTYPACIPSATETCASFQVLTVSQNDCKIKADSGISVTSVGEAFTYPEYFEMSGVIAP